jgi:hypothetical protein
MFQPKIQCFTSSMRLSNSRVKHLTGAIRSVPATRGVTGLEFLWYVSYFEANHGWPSEHCDGVNGLLCFGGIAKFNSDCMQALDAGDLDGPGLESGPFLRIQQRPLAAACQPLSPKIATWEADR